MLIFHSRVPSSMVTKTHALLCDSNNFNVYKQLTLIEYDVIFENLKNSQEKLFLSFNEDRALPGMIQSVVLGL